MCLLRGGVGVSGERGAGVSEYVYVTACVSAQILPLYYLPNSAIDSANLAFHCFVAESYCTISLPHCPMPCSDADFNMVVETAVAMKWTNQKGEVKCPIRSVNILKAPWQVGEDKWVGKVGDAGWDQLPT